jgi:AraC-like DNA-binding protein
LTGLVCGGLRFENGAADALLAALLAVIHVQPRAGNVSCCLQSTVSQLLEELDAQRACREPVITRVGQALALLYSHPCERWTVRELAGCMALSRSAFASRFSHLLGESPHRYLARLRLNVAREHLRHTDDKIAASAGYSSLAAFSRAFKHKVGVSPVEYRRSPAAP